MRASFNIPVLLLLLLVAATASHAQSGVLLPAKDSVTQNLAIEVTTLIEISRAEHPLRYQPGKYPESGIFEIKADNNADSFRVRANHSFIISVRKEGGTCSEGYTLETIKKDTRGINRDVCTLTPLSAWEHQLSLRCYCSTDQWFKIVKTGAGPSGEVLIYSATAP